MALQKLIGFPLVEADVDDFAARHDQRCPHCGKSFPRRRWSADRRRPSVTAARAEQHRARPAPLATRNWRRVIEGATGRGGIGANLSSAHGRQAVSPPCSSRSTAGRSRCADDGSSLLDVLRDQLGLRSPKDGCSPQGQCGCCTVLVDGQPRVACVTPARRVAGRAITTVDGLARRARERWADALLRHRRQPVRLLHARASSCRLEGLRAKRPDGRPRGRRAGAARPPLPLHRLAHDPRRVGPRRGRRRPTPAPRPRRRGRARADASRAAAPQRVGPDVALGRGGFADDTAPADALVAVPDGAGGWAVGETLAEARAAAGKVQGRRTTVDAAPPARRCPPATGRRRCARRGSSRPTSSPTRRGASRAASRARRSPTAAPSAASCDLGRRGGRPRARRRARPAGARAARPRGRRAPRAQAAAGRRRGRRRRHAASCGSSAPPGIAEAIASVAPGLVVEEVDVAGPAHVDRPAGRRAGPRRPCCSPALAARRRRSPTRVTGATAEAEIDDGGGARARRRRRAARRGRAALLLHRRRPHGAVVGEPRGHRGRRGRRRPRPHHPLLRRPARRRHARRSRSRSSPSAGPPVRGGDAVFAAVAAAAWLHLGCPPDWPTGARWR